MRAKLSVRNVECSVEFASLPAKVSIVDKVSCRTINQFWFLNNTVPEVLWHLNHLQSTNLETLSPAELLSSFHMRKSKLREVLWLSSGHRAEPCGQSKNLNSVSSTFLYPSPILTYTLLLTLHPLIITFTCTGADWDLLQQP